MNELTLLALAIAIIIFALVYVKLRSRDDDDDDDEFSSEDVPTHTVDELGVETFYNPNTQRAQYRRPAYVPRAIDTEDDAEVMTDFGHYPTDLPVNERLINDDDDDEVPPITYIPATPQYNYQPVTPHVDYRSQNISVSEPSTVASGTGLATSYASGLATLVESNNEVSSVESTCCANDSCACATVNSD